MKLTDKELSIIEDTDFLLTKVEVITKVHELLVATRGELKKCLEKVAFPIQAGGKISRGEKYRNLPYLVLDYPGLFTPTDIFAFRTMFWWGHFFSCTLHLQGEYLDEYRDRLIHSMDELTGRGLYLGVGATPWEYHYGEDNYQLLSSDHRNYLRDCPFLKLSKKMELRVWPEVPRESSSLLAFFLSILTNA